MGHPITTQTVGKFDTEAGVVLGVSDETYPRVHITPQGEVKTGLGVSAPTPLLGSPGFPAPGQIIAKKVHAPATLTAYSVYGATPVDVDAVNLAVTFTVPPSGTVVVEMAATTYLPSGGFGHWAMHEGAAHVPGSARRMNPGVWGHGHYLVEISGLVAGQVKTWKWAHACSGGPDARIYVDDGSPVTDVGQAYMEVRAA